MRCLPRKTKLGHAGTLDPIASGVLLVCVGPATRLIPYIHQYSKCYRGTFQFGQYSETDDIEREPTPVDLPSSVTEDSIRSVLSDFRGEIDQVPPRFSAVRVNGERAYDVARRGEDFELEPKKVNILSLQAEYQTPTLTLDVECGTGTYIRSLGRDIANKMSTQCVMTDLVRTGIGPFTLESALNIDDLTTELIHAELHSPVGLDHYPQFIPDEQQIDHLRHGASSI
ncbi:UNVERIFIED_CONTAM: hypothetical protein GTU68_006389 [Idotea baltica]|nr:hypothetical protein [Idotea baltica]